VRQHNFSKALLGVSLAASLMMVAPADAHAQAARRTPSHGGGGRVYGGPAVRGPGVVGPGGVVRGPNFYRPFYYRPYYYRPYFYDPFFWGTYGWGWGWGAGLGYGYGWGWAPYGYWGYPYGAYGGYGYPYYGGYYRGYAEARILVTPKEAKVYVDGYYAGIVDDFNGWTQRLDAPPGEHEVAIYLEGYRTLRQRVLFQPGKTVKITGTLERLAPGQPPEPVPQPMQPPQPPPGTYQQPYPGGPPAGEAGEAPPAGGTTGGRMYPPPPGPQPYGRSSRRPPQATARATNPSEFGTLSIRVQPHDAEITVDGEHWETPESQTGFSIQMAPGRHHVEVKKDGFRPFTADVDIQSGELTPLNVSLLSAHEIQ
jgi:hypothetical protein